MRPLPVEASNTSDGMSVRWQSGRSSRRYTVDNNTFIIKNLSSKNKMQNFGHLKLN